MKKTIAFAITMGLVFVLCTTLQTRAGSILLEQGNYAEETLGDLDKAIGIYEEIVGDSQVSRDDVVEALFRLAQCQLKKGNRVEAGTTLNKLLMNYPGQSRFIGKAGELLAKLQNETAAEAISSKSDSAFSAKALIKTAQPQDASSPNRAVKTRMPFPHLKTPKWPHGQGRKWRVSSAYNPKVYESSYSSINAATVNGKKYWCFELVNTAPRAEYYRVFVDQDTFSPVISFGKSDLQTIHIKYGEEEIEIRSNEQGLLRSKSIPVKGFVFDEFQIRLLLELMPWAPGFQVTIPVFSAANAAVRELRIKATGTETVTVPAGTFDCYKIMTQVKRHGTWVEASESWFSVEKNTPIKAIIGAFTMELVETAVKPKSISSFQEGALEALYGLLKWWKAQREN